MLEKMCRIAWMCNQISGHGDYCLTRKQAEAWIERLTKAHPDMNHWIEEA